MKIVDVNGNVISIDGGRHVITRDNGSQAIYADSEGKKWLATVTVSGAVIIPETTHYTIKRANAGSLVERLDDLADELRGNKGLNYSEGWAIRRMKKLLTSFNSTKGYFTKPIKP